MNVRSSRYSWHLTGLLQHARRCNDGNVYKLKECNVWSYYSASYQVLNIAILVLLHTAGACRYPAAECAELNTVGLVTAGEVLGI